jgi:predicted ATPase/class 3 adenylate cyclase
VVAQLPSGTVTFLFTDLQGSTRLWERYPVAMATALARHDEILHRAIGAHRGHVVKSTGDGIHAVFSDAADAVAAAVEAQRELGTEPWPVSEPFQVRMGLHTGAAESRDGDYFGTAVNRAARLMAAAHGGQVVVSRATEQLSRDALPSELAFVDLGEHRLRDLARAEHVFQLVGDGLTREFPPLSSLSAQSTNLPVQLTSFVGRHDELKALGELLEDARLVSLLGPGGCGKTRLAVQAAAEALEVFTDGVWFVDLAGVRDPDLVGPTVATALQLQEEVGRTYTDTLLDYLRERNALVVLDNCEHLIDACAALTHTVLRGCRSLRVMATTREPLGVEGEVRWRVPPLAVPAADVPVAADLIPQYEALQLFFDRAARARPGFPVDDHAAAVAAEICRRLDGIPLAIELAAARVGLLGIEEVLVGLADQLRLLGGGPRTVATRHQTITASIEWSHALLTEPERVLFRRLSVFSGGFDLDACARVCSGDPIEPEDVLGLLGALVDRSLVTMTDEHGVARFSLLETIRQFGAGELVRAHEAPAVRTRHLEHYMAFAELAAPMLERRGEREWMDRLELEHHNLRRALEWSLTEDVESGLRLAAALHHFWYVRGHYSEGARWFERLFDVDAAVAPKVRANALYGDSYLTGWGLGRFDAIIPRLHECVALARQAGDPRAAGRASWALGAVLTSQQPAAACTALEEAIRLAREADDTWCLSSALSFLGTARFNTEGGATAFRCFEEALAVARRGEHVTVLTGVLGSCGTAAIALGDYQVAERSLTECLSLARELGHRLWISGALGMLASLAARRGRYDEARQLAEDAISAARDSGNALVMMGAIGILGLCALAGGDLETAAQHYEEAIGAARAMRAPAYTAVYLAALGEVCLALGDRRGARAHVDEGRQLAELGRPLTQAQLLNLQGRLARAEGDPEGARTSLYEALHLFRTVGDPQGEADTLEDLAGVAADQGRFEPAARLLGEAHAIRDRVGYVRFPHREREYRADVRRASTALGP